MKQILPEQALKQHIAVVGKTGSGKTYTAKGIVEQLLAALKQVCIVDPTGAWYGLRSSENGKKAGFPVMIFGGHHGDAALPPLSGHACAELVTTTGVSCIFDTSSMSVGERTRWAIDFFGGLYRLIKKPLHLVIDEAHMFAPQGSMPDPQVGMMLHAVNTLASGGRSRGVRLMAITQRPAKLHKDTLTCCDTLIAMRLIAPQDRKAVEEWIMGMGDPKKGKDVLDSLAQLKRGEGWVWYPEGGVLERTTFPKITTFDSSATPDDGEAAATPKTLAEIDLSGITAAMQQAVETAKANDPAELRKRIKELERQVAEKPKAEPADIEAIRHQAKIDAANGLASILSGRANHIRDMGIDIAATVREKFNEHEAFLREVVANTVKAIQANTHTNDLPRFPQRGAGREPHRNPAGAVNRDRPAAGPVVVGDLKINKTQQRVLDALAWYESLGNSRPSLIQVGAVALIDVTGGHFSNTVGPLSTAGLVERGDGYLSLTNEGRAAAQAPEAVGTLNDYHNVLRARVRKMKSASGKTIEILDCIIANGEGKMSTAEIGKAVGIDHTGGHFSNSIGPLGTAGLITRKDGIVTPTEVLFPEALA